MRRGRPQTRQLMFALLAAVILGILGMHAFARHDSMPMSGSAHRTASAAPVAGMPMEHTHVASQAGVPAGDRVAGATPLRAAVGTSVVTVESPGLPMGSMIMLCTAMLLAAAGALLALRLRGLVGTGGLPLAPPRRLLVTRLAARVGTGPPYVWEYSVVRC